MPQRSGRPGQNWLAVAAALLVAAIAGLWITRHRAAAPVPAHSPPASEAKLANPWRELPVAPAAYRPGEPEDELVFRSGEKPGGDGFLAAMGPYMRGDYAAADAGLARFLAAHPGHAEAGFYRGVSLLMLGKPSEARALLESAAAAARPPAQARWYAALALLKSGDEAGALAELDAVGQAAGPHRAEATELAEAVRRGRNAR